MVEITSDRMKTESHTSPLNRAKMIEHRFIPCYRPVYTVLHTQGPLDPNPTKLNKVFHKGDNIYIHSHRRGFRSPRSVMPRVISLSNRLQREGVDEISMRSDLLSVRLHCGLPLREAVRVLRPSNSNTQQRT